MGSAAHSLKEAQKEEELSRDLNDKTKDDNAEAAGKGHDYEYLEEEVTDDDQEMSKGCQTSCATPCSTACPTPCATHPPVQVVAPQDTTMPCNQRVGTSCDSADYDYEDEKTRHVAGELETANRLTADAKHALLSQEDHRKNRRSHRRNLATTNQNSAYQATGRMPAARHVDKQKLRRMLNLTNDCSPKVTYQVDLQTMRDLLSDDPVNARRDMRSNDIADRTDCAGVAAGSDGYHTPVVADGRVAAALGRVARADDRREVVHESSAVSDGVSRNVVADQESVETNHRETVDGREDMRRPEVMKAVIKNGDLP
jgi:hypothetical protein